MKRTFWMIAVSMICFAGTMFAFGQREEARTPYSCYTTYVGDELIRVYINGEDVTEEYKQREQDTKERVAAFLNRECSELEFHDYCMLELDGMTVGVTVEDIDYTVLFNIDGELLNVSRTDGKQLQRNR